MRVEITKENVDALIFDEDTNYLYRGLDVKLDHEYNAGVYIVWLHLPSGPNYFRKKRDIYGKLLETSGDLPYCHQYDAGYMFGEDSGPYWRYAIKELMEYVDKYYEFLSPYISNKTEVANNE